MNIIAATQNRHKIDEIKAITKLYGMDIIPRDEAGVPDFEIDETGDTFEENSYLKAKAIMDFTNQPTIADDSGLSVDALDGEPGVYSARYAGVDGDKADDANNARLLEALDGIPDGERTAKFVCVITLLFPDGRKIVTRGECPGKIAQKKQGDNGFGYDPLFIPDGFTESYAQLPPQEKNRISHRGRALEKLKEELGNI